MLRRTLRWLAVALVLVLAGAYAIVNLSGHDPARWHVDPATVALSGQPNEVLAAPAEATEAEPQIGTRVRPVSPEALLTRFDAIARAQPRTQVVAGDVASGMVTYVQRTPTIGFPDYITVKAVPVELGAEAWLTHGIDRGAALIVFSRSRYGQNDLGVNRRRVQTWLAELGPPPPPLPRRLPAAPRPAAEAESVPDNTGDAPAEGAE